MVLADRQAAADVVGKEYIAPIFPEGTFLRGDRLINVNDHSDLPGTHNSGSESVSVFTDQRYDFDVFSERNSAFVQLHRVAEFDSPTRLRLQHLTTVTADN